MKRSFLKSLALGICYLSTTVLPQETNRNEQNRKEDMIIEESNEIPCLDYLFPIGNKLGFHFTLEYRAYALTGTVPKIQQTVSNDQSIASVSALISKLRRDLPGYTVLQDSKNPRIVHIIEQALEQQKDYVLNKKVSVRYSGNLVGCVVKDQEGRNLVKGKGLVTTVAKKAGGIQSGPPSHDGREAFDDCFTQVSVNVKNETVRSILTDCIPIANYKSILWRAVTTRDLDDRTVVKVQFYGPNN